MIFDTSLSNIHKDNILQVYNPKNNYDYLQIIKNFVESGDFKFWVDSDNSFILCHDTTRDSYRVFAPTKESFESGLSKLNILSNNSLPIHIRVNENYAQQAKQFFEKQGYQITYDTFNAWKMIQKNLKIPNINHLVREVKLGDVSLAPLIASAWPFEMWGNVDKLTYFTHALSSYPSSVLYEDGKMVAVCIRHNGKTGSMTFTHQSHRNKNAAEKVLLHSTTIGEGWENQFADANVNNVPSTILFKRFGSELLERVVWIRATKLNSNL